MTQNKSNSWISLDFGRSARVAPSAVIFESIGSVNDMKPPIQWEWPINAYVIEGSVDEQSWAVIAGTTVNVPQSIDSEPQYHCTACSSLASGCIPIKFVQQHRGKLFRFIRIRQTARNAMGSDKLYIRHFIVFGSMYASRV